MYVQVYSRIISGNIGNAGGLNAALNQPERSRLFRHDIIQKKHSIIQQGIKSPPEHCIPTVERLYQSYVRYSGIAALTVPCTESE